MLIRIRDNGKVMFESEFRALHPNVSFQFPISTEMLNSLEADPVLEGPAATGGTVYQYSMQSGVQQVNGQWYTKYVLGPIFTDNENGTAAAQEAEYKTAKDAEQAKSVRDTRTQKLADCDWTQLSDAPASNKAAWATYRQALRDITKQSGFPWQVTWPTAPGA